MTIGFSAERPRESRAEACVADSHCASDCRNRGRRRAPHDAIALRSAQWCRLVGQSRCLGPAFARLSAEKPIVILSGNSIDHALVAFGALYAGIPFCRRRRPIR